MDQLRQDDVLGGVEIGQQMVELIDEAEGIAAHPGAAVIVERRGFDPPMRIDPAEAAFEQADRLEQGRLARA